MGRMMSKFSIGFGGQLQSGKDSSADCLADHFNGNGFGEWQRIAFATSLKKLFMDYFHVDKEFIEEWKRKKDEIPPGFDKPIRQALIDIGGGFRKIKGNIWIDKIFKEQTEDLVISDIRYINEAKAVRKKGFAVLVWRPGHENDIQSRSEQELMPFVQMLKGMGSPYYLEDPDIPFDYFLVNDGTLEDLQYKVKNELCETICRRMRDEKENR